jgi:hypothetical protein
MIFKDGKFIGGLKELLEKQAKSPKATKQAKPTTQAKPKKRI